VLVAPRRSIQSSNQQTVVMTIPESLALALQYHQAGQLEQAEQFYRQILQTDPNHADAWHLLGEIAIRRAQNDVAIEYISYAIRLNEWFPHFHNNLGVAYDACGRLEEAIASYHRALQLQPDYAEAQNNLGIVLKKQGKIAEAMACYQHALRLKPDYPEALNNLGIAFQERGKLDDAVACYHHALHLRPNYCQALSNLGNALLGQGKWPEAVASYQQALYFQPDDANAYYNLGYAYRQPGMLDEAEVNFRQAIRYQPDFAAAHNNLGVVLQDQGKLEEALASFQRACSLVPNDPGAHSNYLLCLNYIPGADPDLVFTEHCRCSRLYEQPTSPSPPAITPRAHGTPLRIGYVSPDLRWHVLAWFLEPILRHHDPKNVHITAYAEVPVPDETTARLHSLCHDWRRTCGLTDAQVADVVRADGIDILVDLAGHTAGNRLGVFARKPAPIQVTYLGYATTTGLPCIDYRLTDSIADPPGEPVRHTEELLRLPCGFCCYLPHPEAPAVTPPPSLRAGQITFGSMHSLAKLNGTVLDLWCEILKAVPSARLLIIRHTLRGRTKEYLSQQFAARGISEERVEFRHTAGPGRTHLDLYSEIDLSLDTFPWSGHGTACESLWMGVPVLTLRGRAHAGRMVASVLHQLGMNDLIAESSAQYREKAVELPRDLGRLADWRSRLRGIMEASPLCDGKAFTRNLEEVYRSMVDTAVKGHR
jgi:predicted O-linked N-acetylglucosamine transferase (SPINDLY family)